MTRLKIDWNNGILEVEGEESFVREIYNEYKEQLRGPAPRAVTEVPSRPVAHKRKESYQIVKDLDLSGRDGKESLKSFYAKKAPETALERNTVFTYYLQKISGMKGVNANHLFTCYKDVGEKIPSALRQSIIDTSFKKGWIDTKSMDDITLTTHGETLVEHELPRR